MILACKNYLVKSQKFWDLGRSLPPYRKNSQKIPYFFYGSPYHHVDNDENREVGTIINKKSSAVFQRSLCNIFCMLQSFWFPAKRQLTKKIHRWAQSFFENQSVCWATCCELFALHWVIVELWHCGIGRVAHHTKMVHGVMLVLMIMLCFLSPELELGKFCCTPAVPGDLFHLCEEGGGLL